MQVRTHWSFNGSFTVTDKNGKCYHRQKFHCRKTFLWLWVEISGVRTLKVTCSLVAKLVPLQQKPVDNKVLAESEFILLKSQCDRSYNARLNGIKKMMEQDNTKLQWVSKPANMLLDKKKSLLPQAHVNEQTFNQLFFAF